VVDVVGCGGGVFLEETVLEIFQEKLHGIMENGEGFMMLGCGCDCGDIQGNEMGNISWIHFR
jgi:hypothetical protein